MLEFVQQRLFSFFFSAAAAFELNRLRRRSIPLAGGNCARPSPRGFWLLVKAPLLGSLAQKQTLIKRRINYYIYLVHKTDLFTTCFTTIFLPSSSSCRSISAAWPLALPSPVVGTLSPHHSRASSLRVLCLLALSVFLFDPTLWLVAAAYVTFEGNKKEGLCFCVVYSIPHPILPLSPAQPLT